MSRTQQQKTVTTSAVAPDDVRKRAEALSAALDAGGSALPAAGVASGRAVLAKVGERTLLGGSHTVVALAGATGSGKSSLFNALVGEPVSRIGARRPTTARPTAAVWGSADAGPLLDWLGVAARHQVATGDRYADLLDGLVLLDLPDFDSRVPEHRREADRVLARVDVFVWVTDPQKYADALLHDEYVRVPGARRARTLAVLNQTDRLAPDDARACAEDLAGLLAADGAGPVDVVCTSALDGSGVADLADRIGAVVQAHNAAEHRLVADLAGAASALQPAVGDTEPEVATRNAHLAAALAKAAGVPAVIDAVRRDYQRESVRAGGWPPTRWLRRLRPAPMSRLGLQAAVSDRIGRKDARRLLGRSSLPEPTPAARAAVDLAVLRLVDEASDGLPAPWATRVAQAADGAPRDLQDALDQAVLGTDLTDRDPSWWRIVSVLQWVGLVGLLAGALWLLVAGLVGLTGVSVAFPQWLGVPLPFWLLLAGLVLGIGIAALSRWLAAVGARRRADRIRRRLHKAISGVARTRVVEPTQAVLAEHRVAREQLAIAAHP